MVRVSLPGEVELTCPECQQRFKVASRSLSGRSTLTCPFCAQPFQTYDAFDGLLKRQVYHAVRDAVEHRVYEQKHMESPEYFEDKANLD